MVDAIRLVVQCSSFFFLHQKSSNTHQSSERGRRFCSNRKPHPVSIQKLILIFNHIHRFSTFLILKFARFLLRCVLFFFVRWINHTSYRLSTHPRSSIFIKLAKLVSSSSSPNSYLIYNILFYT